MSKPNVPVIDDMVPMGVARKLAIVAHRSPERSIARRCGDQLSAIIDRAIGASSLVADTPVLDMRDFAWTESLRRNWRDIRSEADAAMLMDRDCRGGDWHKRALCSETGCVAELIAAIPGVHDAFVATLAPGAHAGLRRDTSKALISCHLGLKVPRDGDARMRIGNRVVRWAEGETIVFDASCDNEAWNDTGGTLTVLAIRFARPLCQPGKMIAALAVAAQRGRIDRR